jgi:hypothetical protein
MFSWQSPTGTRISRWRIRVRVLRSRHDGTWLLPRRVSTKLAFMDRSIITPSRSGTYVVATPRQLLDGDVARKTHCNEKATIGWHQPGKASAWSALTSMLSPRDELETKWQFSADPEGSRNHAVR